MQADSYIATQILLGLEVEDYPQICSINKYYAQLCSSEEFWTQKYEQAGCLLLERKPNLTEYIRDFQNCQKISKLIPIILERLKEPIPVANQYPGFPQDDRVLITHVQSVEHFQVPEINRDRLQRFQNFARSVLLAKTFGENYQIVIESFFDYFDILPVANFGYSRSQKSYYVTFMVYDEIRTLLDDPSLIGYQVDLSEKAIWKLLYVLVYFGYKFEYGTSSGEVSVEAIFD